MEVGGLQRAAMETTAAELAKLLYWLMVVGYSIHCTEVRYDNGTYARHASKTGRVTSW